MIAGSHGSMQVRGVAGHLPCGSASRHWRTMEDRDPAARISTVFDPIIQPEDRRREIFERESQIARRDVIGQHPCHVIPSVTLLRRQRGAMLLVLTE
jgi:hypothetical protein